MHVVKGPLLLFTMKPVVWSWSHRCAHLHVPKQQPPHTPLLHSPIPAPVFAQGHCFHPAKACHSFPLEEFQWKHGSCRVPNSGPAGWVALPPSVVEDWPPHGLIPCSHCCHQLREKGRKSTSVGAVSSTARCSEKGNTQVFTGTLQRSPARWGDLAALQCHTPSIRQL